MEAASPVLLVACCGPKLAASPPRAGRHPSTDRPSLVHPPCTERPGSGGRVAGMKRDRHRPLPTGHPVNVRFVANSQPAPLLHKRCGWGRALSRAPRVSEIQRASR